MLRWLIVVAAALTVAALFHWLGELLRGAVKQTAAGWLDRGAGLMLGAALGWVVATFLLLAMLSVPWPRSVAGAAVGARVTLPAMTGGAVVCAQLSRYFPGSEWLRRRFAETARRLEQRSRIVMRSGPSGRVWSPWTNVLLNASSSSA